MAQLKATTINEDKAFGIPIGVIAVYDRSDWIDPDDPYDPTNNPTMPGWYACISVNVVHGCPSLLNRFIVGCDKSFELAYWDSSIHAYSGRTTTRLGNNNSITFVVEQLPQHLHVISHTHSSISGENTAGNNHRHPYYPGGGVMDGNSGNCKGRVNGRTLYASIDPGGTYSSNHRHSISATFNYVDAGTNLNNFTVKDGGGADLTQTPCYLTPNSYRKIYVRRCY